MRARGRDLCFALVVVAAAVGGALGSACTWTAWTPDRGVLSSEDVTTSVPRSEELALNVARVDELSCYSRRCQKRFRLAIRERGRLTLRAVPELASQDDQMRIALESTQGVLAQDESARLPRTEPTVLSLTQTVEPGLYFVLLQSFGGPVPYQLTARLRSAAAPPPPPSPGAEPSQEPPSEGPPRRLETLKRRGNAGAGFDPAVSFDRIRTFAFPPVLSPEEARQAGVPLEQPIDREIRRLLTEELRLRGLRQASGGETADAIVDFSTRRAVRTYRDIPLIYDWYELDTSRFAYRFAYREGPDASGTLVVDIIDTRDKRIAWHAWTSKGIGPGITPGEKSRALLREAVTEVLSGYPPR